MTTPQRFEFKPWFELETPSTFERFFSERLSNDKIKRKKNITTTTTTTTTTTIRS